MAEKTLHTRIISKHDTSTNWARATSFVPKNGEIIVYSDLNKIKIGNGSSVVGALPFLTAESESSSSPNLYFGRTTSALPSANSVPTGSIGFVKGTSAGVMYVYKTTSYYDYCSGQTVAYWQNIL